MVMYTSLDFPNEATASMQLELFDHEMLQSPFELKLAEKNTAFRDINYINIQNRIDKTATKMSSNETNQFIAPYIFYRLIYSSIYVHDFSIKRQSIHYQMLHPISVICWCIYFAENEINQHFKWHAFIYSLPSTMRFSIIHIWSYYEGRACVSIMNDITFHLKWLKIE